MTETEITNRINNLIDNSQYSDYINYYGNEYSLANYDNDDLLDIIHFIKNRLDFRKRIIVPDDFRAIDKDFSSEIDISYCTFKGLCLFVACNFNANFTAKHARFEGETKFARNKFNYKTRFHHTHFLKSVDFENATFNSLIDFLEKLA